MSTSRYEDKVLETYARSLMEASKAEGRVYADLDKSDETDENSLGMACVKFVDAAPTVLQVTSKTEALGSDTDV